MLIVHYRQYNRPMQPGVPYHGARLLIIDSEGETGTFCFECEAREPEGSKDGSFAVAGTPFKAMQLAADYQQSLTGIAVSMKDLLDPAGRIGERHKHKATYVRKCLALIEKGLEVEYQESHETYVIDDGIAASLKAADEMTKDMKGADNAGDKSSGTTDQGV